MLTSSEVNYNWARENLAQLIEQIIDENASPQGSARAAHAVPAKQLAIISDREQEAVAMLPARELSSILETLHLL